MVCFTTSYTPVSNVTFPTSLVKETEMMLYKNPNTYLELTFYNMFLKRQENVKSQSGAVSLWDNKDDSKSERGRRPSQGGNYKRVGGGLK